MTGRHRRLTPFAATLAAVATLVSGLIGSPANGDTPGPRVRQDVAVQRGEATPGAVNVLNAKYGLSGSAATDGDATRAFAAAIGDALRRNARRIGGPAGPQAVVWVPGGSYRLGGLVVPSNVRLEVSADAVLEPVRVSPPTASSTDPSAPTSSHMLLLGGHSAQPVTNVSVVAVGSGTPDGGLKARAQPTYQDWDLSGYFTVDLDASDSGSPSDYGFAALVNVRGFEISGVYVVQNDTIPECTATTPGSCQTVTGAYPSPTTGRAAIIYKPARASGNTSAGPFYDPTDGRLSGLYSVGAPFGFGPTQITSGHRLVFEDLYSEGGTTLRLETDDAPIRRYAGELADVTARHVVGVRCNRAVALAAHRQHNHRVAISDVTAIGCQSGLVQSSKKAKGSFTDTTVSGLTVVGAPGAQVGVGGNGLWRIGTSWMPAETRVSPTLWSANVTGLSCQGTFTAPVFDVLVLDGVRAQPVCAS